MFGCSFLYVKGFVQNFTKFDTITVIVCLLRKILLNFFIDFYVVDVEFCVIKIARSFRILRNCTQLVAVYNWNSNVKSAEVVSFFQNWSVKTPKLGIIDDLCKWISHAILIHSFCGIHLRSLNWRGLEYYERVKSVFF